MNSAHLHLIFNHLPVSGTIFSTLLLLAGIIFKNDSIKKAGLYFFIMTALIAIPALLTGEGAEDVLESIGQKNEHFIHEHEELAEKAFWIAQLTGLISIFSLLFFSGRKALVNKLMIVVLLCGLANCVIMTLVSNNGGEIRHTEIRATQEQ